MTNSNRLGRARSLRKRWHLPLAVLVAALLLQPGASIANQEDHGWRWFEVEVLVFRYNEPSQTDAEQFPLQIQPFNVAASRDLIGSRYGQIDLRGFINALPLCSARAATVANRSAGEQPAPLFPIIQQRLTHTSADTPTPAAINISCKRQPHLALVPAWYGSHQELYSHTVSAIPQVVTGSKSGSKEELLAADIPFTVHPNNFRFQQLRQQFERRSDTEVLLHTAWQQPVFNRNRGRKMRIVGGRNLSNEFNFMGFAQPQKDSSDQLPALYANRLESYQQSNLPIASNTSQRGLPTLSQQPESQALFSNLNRLFSAIDAGDFAFSDYGQPDNSGLNRLQTLPAGTPNEVWELDGLLEIYLVGNFLHIAPELNLREVITLNPTSRSPEQQVDDFLNDNDNSLQFLRNYPLAQLRRVISHQLHYFDHPNYAMLIEIRRTDLSARR